MKPHARADPELMEQRQVSWHVQPSTGLPEKAHRELRRQALAQFRDAVTIMNRNRVIEYGNAAFVSMTGYSAEEAIGHNVSLLQSGEHDDRFRATGSSRRVRINCHLP